MIDAGHLHDVDRRPASCALARAPRAGRRWPAPPACRARPARSASAGGRRASSFAGSVTSRLWNSGVVHLAADVRRQRLESLAGDHRLVDASSASRSRACLSPRRSVRSARAACCCCASTMSAPVMPGVAISTTAAIALVLRRRHQRDQRRLRCGRRRRCASDRRPSAAVRNFTAARCVFGVVAERRPLRRGRRSGRCRACRSGRR